MENNFFSTDKLVEFGMSMAIANQMASSMNQAMSQTQIPGAGSPQQRNNSETVYYAVIDNQSKGPYSISEISRLINEKKIVKETYVWKPGMTQWELAEKVDEILRLVALTPPPIPVQ